MPDNIPQFVDWFRSSSPYINAFRGRTFVVVFGGEVIAEQRFTGLAHDIALLNSLGIRLVLVHGSRPQIEQRLRERKVRIQYLHGRRVTDKDALECVKEAAGVGLVEIEAMLSMGLANTPMAGARIRVASGNFVTARPLTWKAPTIFTRERCAVSIIRRFSSSSMPVRSSCSLPLAIPRGRNIQPDGAGGGLGNRRLR